MFGLGLMKVKINIEVDIDLLITDDREEIYRQSSPSQIYALAFTSCL